MRDRTFTKVLHPGSKARVGKVFVRVDYVKGELSLTGVEGPMRSGNAKGSAGQIAPVTVTTYAPGWDAERLGWLNRIWEKYHMNYLHAGCAHQDFFGWTWKDHPTVACPICDYHLGTAWNTVLVPEAVLDILEQGFPPLDCVPAWV